MPNSVRRSNSPVSASARLPPIGRTFSPGKPPGRSAPPFLFAKAAALGLPFSHRSSVSSSTLIRRFGRHLLNGLHTRLCLLLITQRGREHLLVLLEIRGRIENRLHPGCKSADTASAIMAWKALPTVVTPLVILPHKPGLPIVSASPFRSLACCRALSGSFSTSPRRFEFFTKSWSSGQRF